MKSPTITDAWVTGRNNFNLIRLLAAWLVIHGHAWAITGTAGGDIVARLTGIKFAGALAVDMFFVISGFLIAASLERNSVRGYLRARALRILPALAVCVGLSVLVLGPLLSTAPDYWRSPMTWNYFWVNASLWSSRYFLPGVFDSLPNPAINGSLWTLPVEARLYLALLGASLLGMLAPRRYVPAWALAMAAAATFAIIRRPLPEHLANYTWCTAFFITGTLLWVLRDRVRLSPWPLAGLLLLAVICKGTQVFVPMYFLLVCYGTLWLALVPALPRIHNTDLSYGLYLYGWPAAQIVQTLTPGTPWHNTLWTTVLAGGLAAASWFAIERPALRLKSRLAMPRSTPTGEGEPHAG
jgi:peptidoglycan/LPS O-acetylase OafA/YrhL